MTRPRRRGRLIAIEGIDGAGKSTLSRELARRLRRRGWSVAERREPADPYLGHLAQLAGATDPWAGAVYFTLDRHLARPALERDLARHDLVLTDRSYYSTLAYQGSALPLRARRLLERMQRAVTVPPDLVLLVVLDPAFAIRRLGRRKRDRGPLERRRVLERVAASYRSLARSRRWRTVDGRLPPDELLEASLRALHLRPRDARERRRPGRT